MRPVVYFLRKIFLNISMLSVMLCIDFQACTAPEKITAKQIDLSFSHSPGFYAHPILLKIAASPGECIRYTTDGSIPTATSALYTGPLYLKSNNMPTHGYANIKNTSLEKNTPTTSFTRAHIIKAAVFKDDRLFSAIHSASYFIQQHQETSFPIISIIANPADFFDPQRGIYVLGNVFDTYAHSLPPGTTIDPFYPANFTQRHHNWQRKIHLEFFQDRKLIFADEYLASIAGRLSSRFSQKSFRLQSIATSFPGNLFENTPSNLAVYSELVLRNGGSRKFENPARNTISHMLAPTNFLDTLHSRPVELFLNGEYWGWYFLQEHWGKNYLKRKYHIPRTEISIVKNHTAQSSAEQTDYDHFIQFASTANLSEQNNFSHLSKIINVESFIDYFITHFYLGNADLSQINFIVWRSPHKHMKKNRNKWTAVLHDLDSTLLLNENTLAIALKGMKKIPEHVDKTLMAIWKNFVCSPFVKNKFLLRFMDLINTIFHPTYVRQKIEAFFHAIPPLMERHYQRWEMPYSRQDIYPILIDFASNRTKVVLKLLKAIFALPPAIKISINSPLHGTILVNSTPLNTSTHHSLLYFPGQTIQLSVIPQEGWDFVGWSNDIVSDNTTLEIHVQKNLSLAAHFKQKR